MNGTPILQTTAAGDRWYCDAVASAISTTGNNDGVREKLLILAGAINHSDPPPDGIRTFRAEVWGNYRLAIVPTAGDQNKSLAVSTSTFGGGRRPTSPRQFVANNRRYALGNSGTSAFQSGAGANGRDDDGSPPGVSDYMGDPLTGRASTRWTRSTSSTDGPARRQRRRRG